MDGVGSALLETVGFAMDVQFCTSFLMECQSPGLQVWVWYKGKQSRIRHYLIQLEMFHRYFFRKFLDHHCFLEKHFFLMEYFTTKGKVASCELYLMRGYNAVSSLLS